MVEPITVLFSFPSANAKAKPTKNTTPVSLVNARKLSVPKSVA